MNISGFKSEWSQPFLFDEELRGHGHVRTVIGNLAEELTVAHFNGRRHKTDPLASYCPDVSDADGYIECKVAGRANQIFVYSGRLEKDALLVSCGYNLRYVVWSHDAYTKRFASVRELRDGVARRMQALYVVPFAAIAALCFNLPVEKLNSAYGKRLGSEEAYGSGYRIKLALLSSFIKERWENGIELPYTRFS